MHVPSWLLERRYLTRDMSSLIPSRWRDSLARESLGGRIREEARKGLLLIGAFDVRQQPAQLTPGRPATSGTYPVTWCAIGNNVVTHSHASAEPPVAEAPGDGVNNGGVPHGMVPLEMIRVGRSPAVASHSPYAPTSSLVRIGGAIGALLTAESAGTAHGMRAGSRKRSSTTDDELMLPGYPSAPIRRLRTYIREKRLRPG